MKNILVKCIIISIILLLIVGIAARLMLDSSNDNRNSPESTTTVSEPLYTITEYNGRIALFKKGFSMPVEIYDVYINSLPQSDRELLINGIDASSDEDAQKLIEDYTS